MVVTAGVRLAITPAPGRGEREDGEGRVNTLNRVSQADTESDDENGKGEPASRRRAESIANPEEVVQQASRPDVPRCPFDELLLKLATPLWPRRPHGWRWRRSRRRRSHRPQSSSVRMPPDAFTPISGPTTWRISAISCAVAPVQSRWRSSRNPRRQLHQRAGYGFGLSSSSAVSRMTLRSCASCATCHPRDTASRPIVAGT